MGVKGPVLPIFGTSMRRHLPNFLTLCNLSCGVLALALLLSGNPLRHAALLVLLAAVFDLLDGQVARALGVTSPLGKDLDSLADLVSFGVVPALVVFELMGMPQSGLFHQVPWLRYLALLIAPLSALRLARFNHDSRQQVDFIGLPTPAHALFWVGWPLVMSGQQVQQPEGWVLPVSEASFLIFLIVLPLLLNSGLRLFSLKFQPGGVAANRHRVLFLALSSVLVALTALAPVSVWLALPLVILLYLLMAVLRQYLFLH